MSGLHKVTKKFDPLGHAGVEKLTGIDKAEKQAKGAEQKAKDMALARETADAAAAERLHTKQVETRGELNRQAAAAAGATRSGNQQDDVAGLVRPKRRYASRVLLGE